MPEDQELQVEQGKETEGAVAAAEPVAMPGVGALLRGEWSFFVSVATAAIFWSEGGEWFADAPSGGTLILLTVWLFVVVMASAFAVVRHADALAIQLGEPYGTLVLTLSVISIEVMMISAVMLTGSDNPTLARDTMYAVVMIVLNGMVGLNLLLGGIRHHEQEYNLQGANAFLAVILPLAVICLILPNFTQSTSGPTLSTLQEVFVAISSLALYGVFLAVQTVQHRSYFLAPNLSNDPSRPDFEDEHPGLSLMPTHVHAALLVAYLLPIVLLSKKLAYPIDIAIDRFGAPVAFGGFLVAILVLSPEVLSATRAALANRLQRSVNIFLGLGDCDHRAYGSRRSYHQPVDRKADRTGPQWCRFRSPDPDPGRLRGDLRKRADQCSPGSRPSASLRRLRDVAVRLIDVRISRDG